MPKPTAKEAAEREKAERRRAWRDWLKDVDRDMDEKAGQWTGLFVVKSGTKNDANPAA